MASSGTRTKLVGRLLHLRRAFHVSSRHRPPLALCSPDGLRTRSTRHLLFQEDSLASSWPRSDLSRRPGVEERSLTVSHCSRKEDGWRCPLSPHAASHITSRSHDALLDFEHFLHRYRHLHGGRNGAAVARRLSTDPEQLRVSVNDIVFLKRSLEAAQRTTIHTSTRVNLDSSTHHVIDGGGASEGGSILISSPLVRELKQKAKTSKHGRRKGGEGGGGGDSDDEDEREGDHLITAMNARMKDVLDMKLKKKSKAKAPPFLTCRADDLVIDAVKKMTNGDVGSLVVIDAKSITTDYPVGIITERDVLKKIVAQSRSPTTTKVKEVMTGKTTLIVSTPDVSVYECMHLMTKHRIRHIPIVLGPEQKLVGIVSIRDMVDTILREKEEEQRRLQSYISGSY